MTKKNNKRENSRLSSTIEYIDGLQEKYSKLSTIRADFAYKKPYSNNITLEEVKKDLKKITSDTRNKPTIFKHQVGYIAKIESTEDKGIHVHTTFFFDGQKIKNDVMKGNEIGEYWNESITHNKGTFHNCNLNANKIYGDNNAMGILDHSDTKKREKLNTAVSYLCKDDEKQDISSIKTNKNYRAFVRGTIPKKKSNKGRPRKV